MKKQMKFGLLIGMVIYSIGIVIGLIFLLKIVWSNVEGMSFWESPEVLSFEPDVETDGIIQKLYCPVIMTPNETKEVWVRVKNPKDYPITPFAQITISHPGLPDNMDRNYEKLSIAPQFSKTSHYFVSSENIQFGRVIYVRAFLYQGEYYPPSVTRHCSIVVTQIGDLSSKSIFWLVIGTTAGSILVGILLWWLFSSDKMLRSNKMMKRMVFIAISLFLSLLSKFLGLNLLAIILTILTLLIIVSVLENLFMDWVNRSKEEQFV